MSGQIGQKMNNANDLHRTLIGMVAAEKRQDWEGLKQLGESIPDEYLQWMLEYAVTWLAVGVTEEDVRKSALLQVELETSCIQAQRERDQWRKDRGFDDE